MQPRLHRRVQRYGWDRAATIYDQRWEQQLAPANERLLELAELEPGERVLDVACGTGALTFPAAEAVGSNGAVVGVDISDEMVSLAKVEAIRRGEQTVNFEQMDAEELGFEDNTFDVVICGMGLMYPANPTAAIREMRRVLESGGRVAVAVWGDREACGWAEIFPIVEARVSSEVCPLFFQFGTGDRLRYTLEAAGFEEVFVDRLSTQLWWESAEQAIEAAFAAGPVAMAYSRFDEPTRKEAHREYLDSIEPYRHDEGYRLPGEFVVASAFKP